MTSRALKLSRPSPRVPKPIVKKSIVKMNRFPAISAGIRFWESARERAFDRGFDSLGRMADEIATAHRSAWARFAARGDCLCPICGGDDGPGSDAGTLLGS